MENDQKISEKELRKTVARQQKIITMLTDENGTLKARMAVLETKLEQALLTIEELQRIIFRGKKPKGDGAGADAGDPPANGGDDATRTKRTGRSYRRPTPKEEDVTAVEEHLLDACPKCETLLSKIKLLEFYEEDVIPLKEWHERLKKITKKIVATGYCARCEKRVAAAPIPKQRCVLGENIRTLVAFQITVQQFSFSQAQDFSESVLGMKISDGEIANILAKESGKLKPAYEEILERIRAGDAAHADETGWKTASVGKPDVPDDVGNWAWAIASASSPDVAFAFGKTRSKKSAQELFGDFNGVGITDDYNAYKYAFARRKHALCWAHPDRKLRDLKNSRAFSKAKMERCEEMSGKFSALYARVRAVAAAPFDVKKRSRIATVLTKEFEMIVVPDSRDPEKLASIKRRLAEQKKCYFVCLKKPGIPPDNNRAERELRHLVIKRKKSFGCKTSKGADALSVLYTVVMSLWRRSKRDFFNSYAEAAG